MYIQKISSAVLLLLCLVSITPKSYFHDAIARHTDTVSCAHPPKDAACVHPQGFHCAFTDLVVTAPYVPPVQTAVPGHPVYRHTFSVSPSRFQLPVAFRHAENRGPPEAAA